MLRWILLLLVVFIYVVMAETTTKSPIVLVPGMLGSQIAAKLNKTSTVKLLCDKVSDWFTLWLDYEVLVPIGDYCFADNAKLIYNADTEEYSNNYGVETMIPGFGKTDTVEHLDKMKIIPYFHEIVEYFKGLGYISGKSIRGAPYDWRHAANGLVKNGYYKALTSLIEETYSDNNNTPITLIAHSMGGPVTHFFLANYAEENWKHKYIKQFVSLSGAFGGTMKSLKSLVSGSVELAFFANVHEIRKFSRSLPSIVWLLPHESVWDEDEVLISSASQNYTAKDIPKLFNDLNYTNGTRMLRELQRNYADDFKSPNVTHHCFYGSQVPTMERLLYDGEVEFIEEEENPSHVEGDGDGTVNIRSLKSCMNWKAVNQRNNHGFFMREFKGVSHVQMLASSQVLSALQDLL